MRQNKQLDLEYLPSKRGFLGGKSRVETNLGEMSVGISAGQKHGNPSM